MRRTLFLSKVSGKRYVGHSVCNIVFQHSVCVLVDLLCLLKTVSEKFNFNSRLRKY